MEGRVLGRRAHREFVQIRLAEEHCAPLLEPRHHRGIVGRHEALEDARAGGGPHAARAQVVLQRYRHPVQGPEGRPATIARVGLPGGGQGLVTHDAQVGANPTIERVDPRQVFLDDSRRSGLPCAYAWWRRWIGQDARSVTPCIAQSSMIRGTRKKSPARSGALASISSRGKHGSTSSSRMTLTSGTAWAVGSTRVGVERTKLVDVLQNARQLLAHPLELRIVQRQAGQPRHVLHIRPRDHPPISSRCAYGETAACAPRWQSAPSRSYPIPPAPRQPPAPLQIGRGAHARPPPAADRHSSDRSLRPPDRGPRRAPVSRRDGR